MSDAIWGLIGVLVGGGVTLGVAILGELGKTRAATSARADARRLAKADTIRAAVRDAQDAALAYQTVLREYRQVLETAQPAGPDLAERYAATRSRFDVKVYRTPAAVRAHMQMWESAAESWAQGDGTAGAESEAWNQAMVTCGGEIDRSFEV